MRTAFINASPKFKESASATLLERAKTFIKDSEIVEIGIHKPEMDAEDIEALLSSDAWIFAFPLYIDGIPSHLLSCLEQLEKALGESGGKKESIRVGAIVNCGFYEGVQAGLAVSVMRNWAASAGCGWYGGAGAGGGGGLAYMPQLPVGKGPAVPLDNAMEKLVTAVTGGQPVDDIYTQIAFPRMFYRMGAQIGWRQAIKANGGKKRDLGKRPELD